MNKKGFLLAEETLKIIVALISISFLVFFLTSLYFNNINEKELKLAEAVLKSSDQSVRNNIANLEEGKPVDVTLENPDGWYFLGFLKEEEKPNVCLGESCVCICDKSSWKVWRSWATECTELGVCLGIGNLEKFEEIKIEKSRKTEITISKDSDKISIAKKS